MKRLTISLITALCLGGPAFAEVDLDAFRSCVDTRIENNAPAAECVHAAQAACLSYDPEEQTASATLCFVEVKDGWSTGIQDQMQKISAEAEEQITAIASIELKYDLLANLLQCDRMHDLARLTETPGETIALQKARCEATATGLALTKLILQSRRLP
ncbi:hypothetical protein [Actibacterium pelagium]|uniref:Lysozyme inhibitor LprI N-terminal domain-containing protein n=1 Tax=Actibacterium pelagium TaxID=2029103 RepID=A0A917AK19_9RHOB|nr:hypothetical protein [Actibacterium pelagium]GGE58318.1 hypothetical protein GCM10011517_27530 [Actibacterium pelagium]